MFIENKFRISYRDVGVNGKIKNKSILCYLEDCGGIHSDVAGYGVNDIERTKLSWVVLGWKLKIIKRPSYGDVINVKTWSRKTNKYNAYRDFEVYNDKGEVIAKATSKWLMLDLEKNSIASLPEDIDQKYKTEEKSVFEEEAKYKIEEIENPEKICECKINRNVIDLNNHVHNTSYMDIAYEVLPDEIFYSEEKNNIEVIYKKEIKYGNKVKVLYKKKDDKIIIEIKDEDEKITHAEVKLY